MTTTKRELGSLTRGVRRRGAGRDDATYLFSSRANAARLREAMDDALAGRNMLPFTVEQLRRDLGLGEG